MHKKPPGLPPGTLIYTGIHRADAPHFEILSYNQTELSGKTLPFEEVLELKSEKGQALWLNITGIHNLEYIASIGQKYGIHQLQLEDMVNVNQRPKVQVGDDNLFLTFKMLFPHPDGIDDEQISLYLTGNTVISFQEKMGDVFEPVRNRILTSGGRIRSRQADYLMYALLDVVIDSYFELIDDVGARQEAIEDTIESKSGIDVNPKIRLCKKDLNTLRKAIYPLRDAVATIQRLDSPHFDPATLVFFTDAHDHLVQLAEMIETYRELNAELRDLYMSSLSNRMNEVMKVLTMISTIFIPLSFLAAVYGMNFDVLPELHWANGYFFFWAISGSLALGMVYYFRRRKWF
jgi:magnesium transporter